MINNITALSIKNRFMVIVAAVLVMAAGFYTYSQLPIDAFPDVSPNLVQVFTETDGIGPEEIERFVTFPVETAMNGLPGVIEIRSISNFGLSVVNVYFEEGMDIYFARQLVGERLLEAREGIPEGFGEPAMGPIATGMGQILFYVLEDETNSRSLEEMRTIQDWQVKPYLQTVAGVTEVLGIGGFEKQYHIQPDPNALLKYDITIAELVEKVEANNLNIGAQFIEKNAEEYVIQSRGFASSISDLESIIINTIDGTPVLLRDLAEVKIGGAVRRGLQTRDGEGEVVAGQVIKLIGTNSSTIIREVEKKIVEINKSLPEGVKIVPYYEQLTLVEEAVGTISTALVQGIVFVIILLIVLLGSFRGSIIAAIAIPFSVLFAFIGMGIFGISANLMSFGGLAIAIGMLVDGSIVIVENIDRKFRENSTSSRLDLIIAACSEVARPIFYGVSIIIIVFVPLFTLQGVEGKTFRPLAYTLTMAMMGALIFAMFIAPALSRLLMVRASKKSSKISAMYDRFEKFTFSIYKPMLKLFLKRRILSVVIVIALLFVGVFALSQLGSEFTPELEEGTITMRLVMAPSISINESKRMTTLIEQELMAIPEVTGVVSRIGRGEVGAHSEPVNNVEMFLELGDQESWRNPQWTQEELENTIREELGEIPGVMASFSQPIEMTVDELLEGIRAELAIKLFGDDLATLGEQADSIVQAISDVPGAADIAVEQIIGTPQLLIKIDREAIARFGLNVEDVQSTLQIAVGGMVAGDMFEGTRRFDIVVRYPEKYRGSMEAISRIVIPAENGNAVRLADVASIEEIIGPRQIRRQNGQRFITVQCNVSGRDIGSFVEEATRHLEQEVDLPDGYYVVWGGQFRLQQEASRRFATVIPIVLVIIFVLLFSSFQSVKSTFLILLNIPLALVGGAVALWITGMNMSVPASVGFISLFGVAIGNGLVLVAYMRQLYQEGASIDEASLNGAALRLRPVLMTAFTTALGLLPLLFATGAGSEVQRPLATVVVGGLLTSTLVTLFILPSVFKWFVDKKEIKKT
jgi:cobalt-zinc-cadmium resistance protein CzcA